MLSIRTGLLVLSDYFRIPKYMIRYEGNNCEIDDNEIDGSRVKMKTDTENLSDECPSNPTECNPSAPTMYDTRKYGHNLPCDSATPEFETLPHLPTGIFRCTAGEVLGRGANKCSYYQNPEYFSYHHMSYYDMHMLLINYRRQSPDSGRKP